jgi:hypothetical protein
MNLPDLLPDKGVLLTWLIQAALGVGIVSLLAGLLVGVVGKIPVIGPVLAALIRMLAGNYEKWLNERVPKLAEQAVLATEERWRKSGITDPTVRAQQKLSESTQTLQSLAPGLSADTAKAQVEAALARIRANGMEQKAR